MNFLELPNHVRLILLASRVRPADAEQVQLRQLAESAELDWQEFLVTAIHHRLAPLVFRTLDQLRLTAVPADIHETLRRHATQNAIAAFQATVETGRLIETLEQAGRAQVTVLKGVALSQLLFGSPGTRHVGDLDLLTQPKKLPEQLAALEDRSYRRSNPPCRLTPERTRNYVRFWKDFTFTGVSSGFDLDLHWRLFNQRRHPGNAILRPGACETATTLTIFGLPLRTLSTVDQFLYCAVHAASDAFTYLKCVADVAAFLQLLSAAELDRALALAEELRLIMPVSAAVHVANAWMGSGVASPRLLPIDDPKIRSVHARAEDALRRHRFRPHRDHTSPYQWLRLELHLVPGLHARAEVVRRFLWRPRVWARFDLPDRLFWLYPLLGLSVPPRRKSVWAR